MNDAGDTLWSLIAAPERAVPDSDFDRLAAAAARLAILVSPALAQAALAPAEARLGRPLVEPAAVREDLIAHRFNRARQAQALRMIQATGVEVVVMKGFALAHQWYGDPDARIVGDLDLLVAPATLDTVLEQLATAGYHFHEAAGRPWGFISDASFVPLASTDGHTNIDLHVAPDCYPVYRSLTTRAVIDQAVTVSGTDCTFRAPCATHSLVLCITNAAKDKFGPGAVRRLIDAMIMLRRHAPIDWHRLAALAEAGSFRRPTRVFLGLLHALGAELPAEANILGMVPGASAHRVERAAFARLAADMRALFPEPPGVAMRAWREATLGADPAVVLHNNWVRLIGLVRRRRGLPPGWRGSPQ